MKQVYTVLLTLLAVYASGCPNDRPPQLGVICTLDGHGGCDGSAPDGTQIYKAPSELLNWWAVSQTDAVNLTSWCYGIPKPKAERLIQEYWQQIQVSR